MMAVSLLRKRLLKDKMTKSFMFILTVLSLLVLVFMGVGLYMKSRMILNEHSLWDLLTNADWKPLSEEFGFLPLDRKSTRLNSSHTDSSRMPSSA